MTMERAFSRAVPGLQGGALIRSMLEGAFEAAHEHEDLMRAFALNVDFQDPNQPGRICTSAEADAESLAGLEAFLGGQQQTGLVPQRQYSRDDAPHPRHRQSGDGGLHLRHARGGRGNVYRSDGADVQPRALVESDYSIGQGANSPVGGCAV